MNNFKSWDSKRQQEFLTNAYLELGDTHSLDTTPTKTFFSGRDNTGEDLIKLFRNPNYLQFSAKHILSMDLFPYQMTILNTLWQKRLPMLLAARGGSKTTMLAVYTALRAVLDQGVKIVIAGAGLRQSGLVFEAMEQIWKASPVLRDICGPNNPPKRSVLGYNWSVGDSRVTGIPIGTGEKIRGLRANIIICDEFGSINPEIFETVIRGFAAVQSHGTFDKVKAAYQQELLEKFGIDLGPNQDKKDQFSLSGNQIILSGTSTYQFNHFYKYYQDYCNLIYNKGRTSEGKIINSEEYAIVRIPYHKLPKGLMDKTILEQGEATMDSNIFKMEYGCVFAKDSDGFFPASAIHSATSPVLIGDQEFRFSVELKGQEGGEYVLGIDPASERDNLAITIIKIVEGRRKHVYTWSANRKRFEKDKKTNPNEYKDIYDYNTFIIKKMHELVNRFNIKRINLDSGGGGRSIIEGLKDRSKLGPNDSCIYDMDDEEVMGEDGLHIIKVIQFSKRDWYESAHYNLLKDLTTQQHLFPEYDAVEVEKGRLIKVGSSLMVDTFEDVQYEIEECKYQTTLIHEQTTAKGMKKWDLPSVRGVVTEGIQNRLRKDHFTSLLLANDAARDIINADDDSPLKSYVDSSSNIIHRKIDPGAPMYQGRGMRKMRKSSYNIGNTPRKGHNDKGGSVNY